MKKMLIVEDDIVSQKYLRLLFHKDYEIVICESSEEYDLNYSQTEFDIIMMDISLKGSKSGLDLIKEIRADSVSYTPIICFTANARADTKKMAIEFGTDLFIAKPMDNDLLKDAVSSLVSNICAYSIFKTLLNLPV